MRMHSPHARRTNNDEYPTCNMPLHTAQKRIPTPTSYAKIQELRHHAHTRHLWFAHP